MTTKNRLLSAELSGLRQFLVSLHAELKYKEADDAEEEKRCNLNDKIIWCGAI